MSEQEYMKRIRDALAMLDASGQHWGQITLVVTQGEIRHVNVNFEVTEKPDRTASAESLV